VLTLKDNRVFKKLPFSAGYSILAYDSGIPSGGFVLQTRPQSESTVVACSS
jgi:hypothetical protein